MKPILSSKRSALLAKIVAAVFIIFSCYLVTRGVQAAYLDYQVKNMTAELNDLKMKTMCVGRFLIDVPADAAVSFRGTAIAGWDIATFYGETDEQFESRTKAREIELAAQKNEKGMPSVEIVKLIDQDGIRGRVIAYDREWIPGIEGDKHVVWQTIKMHAFLRTKQLSFSFVRNSADDSDVRHIIQLITRLRPRAPTEIPSETGYCIDGGLIVDPFPPKPSERITMFVGLKGNPDASIMLDMTAGITTPKTLLERDARSSVRQQHSSRFHTFRRGSRPLLGNAGEEILERVHEEDGSYGHDFMWEPIHNNPSDLLTPLMSFEMSTGHGGHGKTVDSSLTDAEAIALWDKMLSSLRVRPVQQAKPVAAVPQQVPLGTWAQANERCPQTGWWECNDGDKDTAILAGRQQYYRKGEGMGQAIQLLPTTAAQRLLGQRPTFTSKLPSMWKLVSRREYPRVSSTVALVEPTAAPVDDATGASVSDAKSIESTVPPGSMAESGMVCPASGWWRCIEANALDGTRWFGRGQNLPMATVRQPLSSLEKLKGVPDVTHRKTPWQLIRHDGGPASSPVDKPASDDDAKSLI